MGSEDRFERACRRCRLALDVVKHGAITAKHVAAAAGRWIAVIVVAHAEAITADRQTVLDAAYAANPNRFVRKRSPTALASRHELDQPTRRPGESDSVVSQRTRLRKLDRFRWY